MNLTDIASILPINTRQILALLNAKGRNNAEIARVVNCEESTVRKWKSGATPAEPFNRRLIAMFELYYPGEKIPVERDDIHAVALSKGL